MGNQKRILGTCLLPLVAIFLLSNTGVESARMLFFFGMSTYSQRINVWPMAQELAERGHSITFISSYEAKSPHPKIIDYVPSSLKEFMSNMHFTGNIYDRRLSGEMYKEWFKKPFAGLNMCKALLEDPDFVKWVKESKFDLVVVDTLVNECGYGMAMKFKAKIILYNTLVGLPWYSDPFGYPDESSSIPDMVFHHHPEQIGLIERIKSTLVPLYFNYIREVNYFPKIEALMKDKLDIPDLPSFSDIERNNISLHLVNYHFAEDYARPFPPHVIPVGGMHCSDETQKLSKVLSEFINKSGDEGFIYISFGSYADLSNFPEHVQQVFFNALKKLKNVKVIWKTEMQRPSDLPKNVLTGKWMPQQALLSHPKIRAFVTHGGLLGIQEAICSGVPLIAFPIFAEQDYNAGKINSREIGIQLEITAVTEDEFLEAISRVLNEDKYARNMKQVSKVFRDRPAKPVDTAVWWTEYVLRHDDMKLIRPLSIYQPWWKKRNLDVWAVLFGLIFIAMRVLVTLVKIFYSVVFKGGKSKQKMS